MEKEVYPLAQVLEVKERRVKQQEKLLAEKKEQLKREEKKLEEAKEARKKVQDHFDDKMAQLRQKMDEGGISPDYQQMKVYLEVVKERLLAEDKKVEAQKQQVQLAEKAVQEAYELLKQRRKEVDKIETHRKDWMQEQRFLIELEEANEQDEMGSIIYLNRGRAGR